jgi:hypothetical protein
VPKTQEFRRLLVETNSQRIKSASVLVRESILKVDPKKAYLQIVNERQEKEFTRYYSDLNVVDPCDDGRRCEISKAKQPFLAGSSAYWKSSNLKVTGISRFQKPTNNATSFGR